MAEQLEGALEGAIESILEAMTDVANEIADMALQDVLAPLETAPAEKADA